MTDHLPPLGPCPFCLKPLTVTTRINPVGHCDTDGCWLNASRISIPADSPQMVELWNTRSRPETTWREEGDIEVLYLGEIAVGRIIPAGKRSKKSSWMFQLRGAISFWHDAKSHDAARTAVEETLHAWLKRAGVA